MINILSFELCEHSGVLYAIMILKLFIKVCKILAPIILIVTIIMALTKAVGNPDELKKVLPSAVKKFIAALAIFFVPTVINYAMDNLANRDPNSFATCSTNANMDYIKQLKEKEEYERKVRIELREQEAAEAAKKANQKLEEDNASTDGNKVYKDKKKQREQQQQQQQGGNGGNNGIEGGAEGSTNTSVPAGTLNIIIGDSRTVGMCAAMTGSYTGCTFGGSPKVSGDDLYICKSAMAYTWFESTAVPAVNKIIADHPGTRYNIISLMGVNFLLGDIDKYVVKYNELANGAWKDQNIILVSVNPVNEQIEASHGYSTKNANIVTFNTKLKNGTAGHSNIGYCDVYNQIKGNFGTSDGLHYTNETSKQIHSLILDCV